MNTFGNIFRLTSFGESHGEAIGGIIDGCPAGIRLDTAFIQSELSRRKPGQSALTTSRHEDDRVEFLSGIFEGQTTGTPIGFIVRNGNQHSADYDKLKTQFRPSHADFTYQMKYGIRDHRGGGRSSARETIARVVGGAVAKLVLREKGISVTAYTSQVGTIKLEIPYKQLDFSQIESTPVRCPDAKTAQQMIDLIQQVRDDGDTIGGVVSCVCQGVPVGLGEPVFGKLHAALGSAMLGINAAKGFDYGMGFAGVHQRGSEVNDQFYTREDGSLGTRTNNSGGIQGGISNGEDIYFRVAFKPVATLLKEVSGRHDPCVLPRAVPIVEAMAAMTLLDYSLLK
ncbi:chorismate synthase [Candidatus Symbiothrix dinenymphae]|uniref:chorismate synthase n=1 Tax=Candidatus Symbiothrix dinenymphae TaxID=467085 RepID=UPI0006BEECCB|nr:chorismate synthase [Candidatus Symbiothrix dinenymphae]GAP71245.1 chorismate synthase [Candidatus Symbiothrix dinenymphae]